MRPVDLRSDTVTRPTAAMRDAIAGAEVGDDVFGDDPTVLALQEETAELLGKEAALFVTSGTQANLTALMSHCERGDEYIVGQTAHTYRWEAGGAAVLGSIQPQPLDLDARGRFDLGQVAAAVKPDDPHFAKTRLLCLENTNHGKVLPLDYQAEACALAADHGLSTHLDGARLWNAAVALGVTPAEVAAPFDSVSVCLSKGLGAPAGSLVCGSTELIARAFRWRKMLGGALRQVGVLAAAGRHALTSHVERLADDHANARALAEGLGEIDGITVDSADTNMVFATLAFDDPTAFADHMAVNDVVVRVVGNTSRMVTHLDVDAEDVRHVVKAAAAYPGP